MIELKNITKKYNERTILDHISFTIHPGQITFIVGTSGAGKTTLLNLIGGLHNPTSGDILFNGTSIQKDLNTYRAKNIGFVFQDFNLISGLSIVQNIEIATEIAGVQAKPEAIASAVKSVGINDPNQKVETLSGGEKQRSAVIRSICKNADVLIADEPTGNLDSSNAYRVLDMLQTLKKGKHIIVVSHDMEKARSYADRIITLRDGRIESDEVLHEADTAQSRANDSEKASGKPSLLHTVFTLGKNSVMLRKGKIVSIAVVIAMAIASLATVISLNRSGSNLSHNVNVNYLENDLINLHYGNTANTGNMEYPFSEDEIAEVNHKYDIKESVPLYLYPTNEWMFSTGSTAADACVKQINLDSFFEERVLSNDIEGTFPSDKHEIILAEDVAQELFEGDCIGKTVSLNDGRGNHTDYTISGINHTLNPSDQIYSFISFESLQDMLVTSLETNIYQRQELMPFQTEKQKMISGGIYGAMQAVNDADNIIYGSAPRSNEEVMISSSLLLLVLGEFDISTQYTNEQILGGKLSSDDGNKLFAKKFAINYNGVFPVTVCGVYASDEIDMRFCQELITEMQHADPVSVDLYVTDPDQIPEIKESMSSNFDFTASAQLETLKTNVSMQSRFFSVAIGLLGVVLIGISCALLNSFAKITVLERKKEVAVIKSLGANNRCVLQILLFDSAIISLLAYLISLLLYGALQAVLPKLIENVELLTAGFPLGSITGIGLLFTFLIFVLTGFNLKKLVKQMPAELLAQ